MKVLVCGGRDYVDMLAVIKHLDAIHAVTAITCVVHGGARGADSLAETWGRLREIPIKCYPAEWERYGRGAGPIRNQQMIDLEHPDLVVAFPGNRGTEDMVRRAVAAGIRVEQPGKETT